MLFSRKPRNRRFERRQVLEVKLRTKEVRAARTRLAGTAAAVCLGTLIGLYLLWRGGEWALDEFVFQNDAFAVRTLDIRTDGSLSRERLRQWAGVKIGDNLLGLNLSRVRRDLEVAQLIRSAAVERVLPNTLRIQVEERVPIAFALKTEFGPKGVGLHSTRYGLDETGYVLRGAEAGLVAPLPGQPESLPELTGFDTQEMTPGRQLLDPKVQSALVLVREFDRSPMAGVADLRNIDLLIKGSLMLETAQGSRVTFGQGRVEEQFRRWRHVHDFASQRHQAIQTLDLSVTNNSPVVLVDARTAPQVPVKTKPSKRSRK